MANKIIKLDLSIFDEPNNSWTFIFPRTSGDMVIGRVGDSAKLGGKDASAFLSNIFDADLEIKDESNNMKGLVSGALVISDDIDDKTHLNNNDAYIKGKLYIQGGQEVATLDTISDQVEGIALNVMPNVLSDLIQSDRKDVFVNEEDVENLFQ